MKLYEGKVIDADIMLLLYCGKKLVFRNSGSRQSTALLGSHQTEGQLV